MRWLAHPAPLGNVAGSPPTRVRVHDCEWATLGEVSAISEWTRSQESPVHSRYAVGVVEIYNDLLTALAGLALFALRRKEKEYLWWGSLSYSGLPF